MTADFVFVDELPTASARGNAGGRPRRWQAQHDAMRANPGRWLLMGQGVNNSAAAALSQCQRGRRNETLNAYGFGFEYACRNTTTTADGKRVADLYGRYVGEGGVA